MDTQTMIILAVPVVIVVLALLVVGFGYRASNLLFLAAALLPIIWLSRWHEIKIEVGESTFVLLWGVFVLLVLLGLATGNWQTRRLITYSARWVLLSLGFLMALMAMSNTVNSSDGNDIIRGLSAALFVVLPFVTAWSVVCWCRIDDTGIQRIVLALMLAGNVLSLMGIATAIAPSLVSGLGVGVSYTTYGYSRAYSPLGGANGTGMALVLVYCLAFGQLLAKRRRLISAITLALAFVALLTTLARGALVGFAVANAFLVFGQRKDLGRRLLATGAIGILFLIPLTYKLNQYYTLERLNLGGAGALVGASSSERMETMKASLEYGLDHFMLGGGWGLVYELPRIRYGYQPGFLGRTFVLGSNVSLTTPHSLPALVFVECGGLAVLVLGLFAWSMWRALYVPHTELVPGGTGLVRGLRAGILGFLVVSLVQDNLFMSDRLAYMFYLYFFTGVAAAAYHRTSATNALELPVIPSLTPSRYAAEGVR